MLKHWRYFAFVALCAYVVLLWVWAYLGFPTEGQICEQAKNGAEPHCAPHNFIVYGFIIIEKYHDTLLVIGTFLLAGVVVIQIRDARKSSERQLRAYLGIIRHSMNEARHELTIVTRNDGQTPAREVIPVFNQLWFAPDADIPADYDFADFPDAAPVGSGPVFISPGQESPWSFEVNWDMFLRFCSGEIGHLYYYGRFKYIDVFGNSRESQFCYQAVNFPGGGGAWRVYGRHNDCT